MKHTVRNATAIIYAIMKIWRKKLIEYGYDADQEFVLMSKRLAEIEAILKIKEGNNENET
jgi:hypothetical protein